MTRHSDELSQNGANKLTYQDISNEISKGNNMLPLGTTPKVAKCELLY